MKYKINNFETAFIISRLYAISANILVIVEYNMMIRDIAPCTWLLVLLNKLEQVQKV
jgi:hypothetical protein